LHFKTYMNEWNFVFAVLQKPFSCYLDVHRFLSIDDYQLKLMIVSIS